MSAHPTPLTTDILEWIGAFYAVEAEVRSYLTPEQADKRMIG